MKFGDLERSLSVRVSSTLYEWLEDFGRSLGLSVSEVSRMILNSVMIKAEDLNKFIEDNK